jgi:GAF domain-containing protein
MLVYVFLSLAASFVLTKFVAATVKHKPKEEVKIIYKNFDTEKANQELIEKKSSDKATKVAANFMKGLHDIQDKEKFTETVLIRLSKVFHIVQGIFFLYDPKQDYFYTSNTFAFYSPDTDKKFKTGEGITGQVAKNQKFLLIDNVPDDYITIVSGLGEGTPRYLAFLPIIHDNKTVGVIEFASFHKFPEPTDKIFMNIGQQLAPIVNKFV